MRSIKGISEIADKYDFYIIDLWGVLHDGYAPYGGAIDALIKLDENNKKIILLSNAPRRVAKAEAVLEQLGFKKEMYDMLLTSGEVTFNHVKKHKNELGNKYFYIGPEKDRHILDGLGLTEVNDAAKADFAIATGYEGFGSIFEEKKHELDECLKHKLHMLIANPDKIVVKQSGEEQICSGIMGSYYTEHGGKVTYFGKPHTNAYEECMRFFGTEDAGRILCIGDSLHTDIAGANMLGADSAFVTGGIHKRDLFDNGKLNDEKLQKLMKLEKQKPTYITGEFRW